MWKFFFGILSVQMILLCHGCNTSIKQDDAFDVTAIKSMSAARAKAFNDGNAAGIADHFTEDGVLMAPGSAVTFGRAAVEDYYRSIFDQYATVLESGYEEVKISGDLAYGRGFAKVKLIPHGGGDTLTSTAKYINILQRQPNGSWLTTHDIWNGNE
ncbi:MAG TPA: SgcJ/EcaC family oxidoreductase [Flavitalea sp.]|nr:SgcJ/EcaC family oxidoreductase [Flavitalea sp.]